MWRGCCIAVQLLALDEAPPTFLTHVPHPSLHGWVGAIFHPPNPNLEPRITLSLTLTVTLTRTLTLTLTHFNTVEGHWEQTQYEREGSPLE